VDAPRADRSPVRSDVDAPPRADRSPVRKLPPEQQFAEAGPVWPRRYAIGGDRSSACGPGSSVRAVSEYQYYEFFTNCGARWLVLRLPQRVLPPATVEPYCLDGRIETWTFRSHMLLDLTTRLCETLLNFLDHHVLGTEWQQPGLL
jgi:hypothetical protein